MIFEDRLIFFPDRDDGIYDKARQGLEGLARVEDVDLTAEDGVRLHGWFLSATASGDSPRPVVLFFHGNAGNVSYWIPTYQGLLAAGADVFALDYRGFGRSKGRPNEAGVYRDAAAAWAWLTGARGITADRILIYGFSLGGGVGTWLATEHSPAGLVLQSTFTSIPDMAAKFFLPARRLVRTQMDSLSRIGSINCPIFMIHGSRDELVPFEHGRRLHAAARPGTGFHEVQGSGHNETFEDGGAALIEALEEFFETCAGGAA